MKALQIIALTVIAAILATSCNTSGCTEGRSAVPQGRFYNSADGRQISLDSVWIHGVGAPGDSVIAGPRDVSDFNMPLMPDDSITRWCITYNIVDADSVHLTDTLTVRYRPQIWFASEACGVMYRFDIKSVECTHTFVDSVKVPSPEVTNISAINIALYMRVANDEP